MKFEDLKIPKFENLYPKIDLIKNKYDKLFQKEENELIEGDHIFVWRYYLYNHHGIYIGNDQVIHFSGEPFHKERYPKIEKTNLNNFLKGGKLQIQRYGDGIGFIPIRSSSKDIVLKRAYILLENRDKINYNLITNNCEHLSIWCKTGYHFSIQVNKFKYLGIYGIKSSKDPSHSLDPTSFFK